MIKSSLYLVSSIFCVLISCSNNQQTTSINNCNKVQQSYASGLSNLYSSQYENAIQNFTDVLNIKNISNCTPNPISDVAPSFYRNSDGIPIIYKNRGIAYFNLGDPFKAKRDFEKSISLIEDSQDKPLLLIEESILAELYVYKGKAIQKMFIQTNHPDSIEAFRMSYKYDPRGLWINPDVKKYKKDADDLYLSAAALEFKSDKKSKELFEYGMNEALILYIKYLEHNPADAGVHGSVGRIYMRQSKFHEAIQSCNIAISIDPMNSWDHFNRAYAKSELGDNRGAILDLDKAINLDPQFKEAYYNRGLAKYNLGILDDACFDLSKAGELGFAQAYKVIKENCN